jgi:hypothetical protein
MSEHPHLWVGVCDTCCGDFEATTDVLVVRYPDLVQLINEGIAMTGACLQNACTGRVRLERTEMKVVPFSTWTVLPPASGCPECGTDHPTDMPHNHDSLTYQYQFRSREAKAGRTERWPTWKDAMAHCTPSVQQEWTEALAGHGIIVE